MTIVILEERMEYAAGLVAGHHIQIDRVNAVENSNDNNFLLGCPIESGNISRRSKLRLEALSKFK